MIVIDKIFDLLEPDRIIPNWSENVDLFSNVQEIIERVKDFNAPYPLEEFKKDLRYFKSHSEIGWQYVSALKYAYRYTYRYRRLKKMQS